MKKIRDFIFLILLAPFLPFFDLFQGFQENPKGVLVFLIILGLLLITAYFIT